MNNIDQISDIPVTLTVELGTRKMSIKDILSLNHGSVVELNEQAGEPLKILVNGKLIGYGEVVSLNDKYGIRVTDVIKSK